MTDTHNHTNMSIYSEAPLWRTDSSQSGGHLGEIVSRTCLNREIPNFLTDWKPRLSTSPLEFVFERHPGGDSHRLNKCCFPNLSQSAFLLQGPFIILMMLFHRLEESLSAGPTTGAEEIKPMAGRLNAELEHQVGAVWLHYRRQGACVLW